MDSTLFETLKWVLTVIILPYLVYNHKRVDTVAKKVDIVEIKVDNIKEDIKEIKEGVNKLVDRELSKKNER